MSLSAGIRKLVGTTIRASPVTIFSKTYCPFCWEVKQVFKDRNIPYSAVELDTIEDGELIQDYLHKATQQRTVPNVFIQGRHVGGFTDVERIEEEGKLDGLLKEKMAPEAL